MDKLYILKEIAEKEFSDIILDIVEIDYKIRIFLIDKSFIDVNVSLKIEGRFSFHWECKNGEIYRYDNFPDKKARKLKSFPFHFHKGSNNNIEENIFNENLEDGFIDFLNFVKEKINLRSI